MSNYLKNPLSVISIENPLASLIYLEIETSNYCSRSCPWCPKHQSVDRNIPKLMEWNLLEKICYELRRFDFKGIIALHNYNEPLENYRLFKEIDFISSYLPFASLAIYTNGDFLDQYKLNSLLKAGVKYIRITRYLKTSLDKPTYAHLHDWLKELNILEQFEWNYCSVRQGFAVKAIFCDDQLIEVISPSISNYNYRGGSIPFPNKHYIRQMPCEMTSTSAAIDYKGNFKMCCNVFAEYSPHNKYIIGNLFNSTFESLWCSEKMAQLRIQHLRANWVNSPICSSCSQLLPENRQ